MPDSINTRRFGQRLNAFLPTLVTDFGINTNPKLVHPSNAFAPISVTPLSITTTRRSFLPAYALSATFVVPLMINGSCVLFGDAVCVGEADGCADCTGCDTSASAALPTAAPIANRVTPANSPIICFLMIVLLLHLWCVIFLLIHAVKNFNLQSILFSHCFLVCDLLSPDFLKIRSNPKTFYSVFIYVIAKHIDLS